MAKLYEIFSEDTLKIAELIQRRRLQLLVHSCIYYELNDNIIDDNTWNKWSAELIGLQSKYPEIAKQVVWYDAFKNWSGSTGAFLPLKDEWVIRKAYQLTKRCLPKMNVAESVKPKKSKKKSNTSRKLF